MNGEEWEPLLKDGFEICTRMDDLLKQEANPDPNLIYEVRDLRRVLQIINEYAREGHQ